MTHSAHSQLKDARYRTSAARCLTLGLLTVLTLPCIAATGAEAARQDTNGPADVGDLVDLPFDGTFQIRCAGTIFGRDPGIFFDGRCRTGPFFERFVSEGAELLGVAGPTNSAFDVGVIVYESSGSGELREIYVLPEQRATVVTGGVVALQTGHFRADYPVPAIRIFRTWLDGGGFSHNMVEVQGSRQVTRTVSGRTFFTLGFGTKFWEMSTTTRSGFERIDSEGNRIIAQASSSGGSNYCDSAAFAADGVATSWCGAGAAVGVLVASGTAGILTAAAVTSAGWGFTAPEGVAAGFGVGGLVGTVGTGVGVLVCGAVGDFVGAAAGDYCESPPSGPEPDPSDISFAPLYAGEPIGDICPMGTIEYTGPVVRCFEGSGISEVVLTDGTVSEVEEVSVHCYESFITRGCVLLSSI